MLIIQIALGIVLALIILGCLPLIVGLLGIGLWLGFWIFLIFLIVSGVIYAFELIPKEWIQFVQEKLLEIYESYLFVYIFVCWLIWVVYDSVSSSDSFKRKTESKLFGLFVRKFSFLEKLFGENSSLKFIRFVLCIIISVIYISIPFLIVYLLTMPELLFDYIF
jgi:hypothetical protein